MTHNKTTTEQFQEPVNVLHLRDTYEVGGPGKTIIETALRSNNHVKIHVAAFVRRPRDESTPFLTACRDVGISVHHIREFGRFDPMVILRIIRLIKTLDIHILHAHEAKSDILTYLVSRWTPIPTLTTLHGWISNSSKQRFFNRLSRRVIRSFDRVIVVSEKMRGEVLGMGVRGDRVCLLNNSIVVENYVCTGRKGYLASRLSRPLKRPIIGYVGRLSTEKGVNDLLQAMEFLALDGLCPTLVFIGDGPENERLRVQVRGAPELKNVHFTGYLRQQVDFLEDLDLLVLPSHTEGLPNVVLEALLMHVPVIATKVGGVPDIIDDGVEGVLVEPHNPLKLAGAIADFLSRPEEHKRMAERGSHKVRAAFNFEDRTNRLFNLYAEMLDSKARL